MTPHASNLERPVLSPEVQHLGVNSIEVSGADNGRVCEDLVDLRKLGRSKLDLAGGDILQGAFLVTAKGLVRMCWATFRRILTKSQG